MERGTCGKNLTWTLDAGTLTISGRGKMNNYLVPYDVPWASSRELIRKVVLEVGGSTKPFISENLSSNRPTEPH